MAAATSLPVTASTPRVVMTKDEILRTMRTALAEEREGIRTLDANAVAHATRMKERVLDSIRSVTDPAERAPLLHALAELKDELRRNLLLLAHARDYLRDAVELCAPTNARRAPRLAAKL